MRGKELAQVWHGIQVGQGGPSEGNTSGVVWSSVQWDHRMPIPTLSTYPGLSRSWAASLGAKGAVAGSG